ncbi:hypothetical protein K493DRAFT_360436 [Basidiobolus meristosporus CBS 931.73]|uniref:Uncharacterized protein n=1 Tax=Basidiobolus meristosporus CBS 931.73 TaxID=1314790 RepID=A0A1Y1XHR1_9FUNG|nr:hypothetical protein K493DRAFT_360436 [Basidiobolus meristosporus CBS 931.73]|eukprot:ORX85287.1 hypothetical protein K493DRAFT_360436 [Basidiobolus meristosporus CBS 931.73]
MSYFFVNDQKQGYEMFREAMCGLAYGEAESTGVLAINAEMAAGMDAHLSYEDASLAPMNENPFPFMMEKLPLDFYQMNSETSLASSPSSVELDAIIQEEFGDVAAALNSAVLDYLPLRSVDYSMMCTMPSCYSMEEADQTLPNLDTANFGSPNVLGVQEESMLSLTWAAILSVGGSCPLAQISPWHHPHPRSKEAIPRWRMQ